MSIHEKERADRVLHEAQENRSYIHSTCANYDVQLANLLGMYNGRKKELENLKAVWTARLVKAEEALAAATAAAKVATDAFLAEKAKAAVLPATAVPPAPAPEKPAKKNGKQPKEG